MKKKTKGLLLVFAILTAIDFIITYAVKLKQPYFNETNPIYIATGALWPLLVIKCIVIVTMYFLLIYAYQRVPMVVRYFFVSIIVIGIIATLMVLPNNFKEYMKEPAEVVKVPQNVLEQQYKQDIISPVVYMYAILLLIFIVWTEIEGEQIGKNRE